MAHKRIANTYLNFNHKIYKSLTKIYGIGKKRAIFLCRYAGVNPNLVVKKIHYKKIELIDFFVKKKYIVQEALKKQIRDQIQLLSTKRLYRGTRHKASLPVRGQRTKTNARTIRRSLKNNKKKKKINKKNIKNIRKR